MFFSLSSYLFTYNQVWRQQEELRLTTKAGFVLPSKFNRILALDYKGVLSDYLLLKVITFFGGKIDLGQPLSEEDWRYIESGLNAVTDLDPYFSDPYILGQGLLTWESGRYEAAIALLKKGFKYRPKNWELPFYIGFNYFYFLGDNSKGAEYLIKASELPGSPKFLPNLAARIGYFGGKSKLAIMFLKGTIAGTSDPNIRAWLERRMVALERASVIEDALEKYLNDHKSAPVSLKTLVDDGYLVKLPIDPYGGEWVVLKNGRVYSTSRFVFEKNIQK